jgi:PAS domain S-box-containing protein
MGTDSIQRRLAVWREAERLWEGSTSGEDARVAARRVLEAWLSYQNIALTAQPGKFLLVADDDQTYVAATTGVLDVLGYEPADIIGRRVSDLAAPELRETTPAQWAAFLTAGRQDGRFRLRAKDGRCVSLHFQARAHHPIPGFHVSRLWPDLGVEVAVD